ncbi:hypothetical protein HYC85_024668 [Camellia sinensis]|uniref:PPM-type phosphatase domain-containing protein n=1 Tax=Camellia sinensis TaxID=4442 RepID=A0A7J7G8S4_CAMSI|nr:hypothetical protein HYC85_024668 [Camellia sinensis]
MGHFSYLFNGLARSFSIKNGRNSGYCGGSESAESMEFGGQEDMMFCGIFDGHGQWGHYLMQACRPNAAYTNMTTFSKCHKVITTAASSAFGSKRRKRNWRRF